MIKISEILSSGLHGLEIFDQNEINKLEKDANWHSIDEILDFAQYGLSLPLNENGEGYPIFRLNEIENGFLTVPKKHVKIDYDVFKKFELKKNDVLYCRTNGSLRFVGRVGLLKKDTNSVFASYLVRLQPKNTVLPEYLMIFLSSNIGRKLIERQAINSI